MTYAILKRVAEGKSDLIRVEPFPETTSEMYIIRDVLIHNDKKMHYKFNPITSSYSWDCCENVFYADFNHDGIYLYKHDRLIDFEDDDSARLYFEVSENE